MFRKFARFSPCDAFHIGQLVCFEAGADFTIHGHHSHYNHGPDWLFTMLLHIDDAGRTDRGTRLYAIDGFDPADDRRYFDAVSNATGRMTLRPARDSGFAPGRLIAFLDSPVSYHGSTPFEAPAGGRGRKILRAHVTLPPDVGHRLYGEGFLDRCTRYRETGVDSFSDLPGFVRDRRRVMAGFREP